MADRDETTYRIVNRICRMLERFAWPLAIVFVALILAPVLRAYAGETTAVDYALSLVANLGLDLPKTGYVILWILVIALLAMVVGLLVYLKRQGARDDKILGISPKQLEMGLDDTSESEGKRTVRSQGENALKPQGEAE